MASNGKSQRALPANHSYVGYKYRAYPTSEQKQLLNQHFGAARYVYNNFIAMNSEPRFEGKRAEGPKNTYTNNYKAQTLLTITKTKPYTAWLANTPAVVLQQSINDAHQAFQNFFNSHKGVRKGRKVGYPNFKRRTGTQSIRYTSDKIGKIPSSDQNGVLKVGKTNAQIKLSGLSSADEGTTKAGILKFTLHRALPDKAGSVTLSKEPNGKYYITFNAVATENRIAPEATKNVGIDMGLTHLATLAYSDGTQEKIANPRFLKSKLRKLAKAQKEFSRKKKGSKNQEKARLKVASIHNKVKEARNDHHNKIVRRIVDENQVIAIETLNVAGMGKTRLAKSIYDAGMSSFLTKIETQAAHSGRKINKVGRWEPTSQVCSTCQHNSGKKPLNVREWTCEKCETKHDRDYNAAKNILVAASCAETLNARGGESTGSVTKVTRRTKLAPTKQESTSVAL